MCVSDTIVESCQCRGCDYPLAVDHLAAFAYCVGHAAFNPVAFKDPPLVLCVFWCLVRCANPGTS